VFVPNAGLQDGLIVWFITCLWPGIADSVQDGFTRKDPINKFAAAYDKRAVNHDMFKTAGVLHRLFKSGVVNHCIWIKYRDIRIGANLDTPFTPH